MIGSYALCGVERRLEVGALPVVHDDLPSINLAKELTDARHDVFRGLARFLVRGGSLLPI